MALSVITQPAPFVDLDTAKAHLRVETTDDDALIEAYIAAACAHIDGPGGWLGRSIGVQTLELRCDNFSPATCGAIGLSYGPVIDVLTVKYLDADNTEQTAAEADYDVTGGHVLRPAYGETWPSTLSHPDAVRIQYRAGYVADPAADPLVASIPASITAAVLLMVGDLFSFRETAAIGATSTAVPMSTTVQALLGPFRVWAV